MKALEVFVEEMDCLLAVTLCSVALTRGHGLRIQSASAVPTETNALRSILVVLRLGTAIPKTIDSSIRILSDGIHHLIL